MLKIERFYTPCNEDLIFSPVQEIKCIFNLIFTSLWYGKELIFYNIVYSKSPVYNNLNGPGVNIKGPCFT
jgi:hypothetical protein